MVPDVGTDPGGCQCDAGTDADAEEYPGFGTGADALYQELEMHKCSATWRCTGSGLVVH